MTPEEINLSTNSYPHFDNIDKTNLRMSEREYAIYNGLNKFRPEIACFYRDGLWLKNIEFDSKSNLLAHLLREIDGGLRDIFEDREKKEELANRIKEEEKYKKYKNVSGHISSFIVSFNLTLDSQIAKDYIDAVEFLDKYAHRSNSNVQGPRDSKNIMLSWRMFEDVLFQLVTHYHVFDRVDSLLSHKKPSILIIKQLPVLLQKDLLKNYFWSNLSQIDWLNPLYKQGYFKGENNPPPILNESTNEYIVPYWSELTYVQKMTLELSKNSKANYSTILNIVDDIVLYNKDGDRIVNFHTDGTILSIVSMLPVEELQPAFP